MTAVAAAVSDPHPRDLFIGFAKIGLLGFGGVAAVARHVIVAERGWLSDTDYTRVIGMGQALPGANTVNAAVMIGRRFAGATGAVAAVMGLLAPPIIVLILLATLYESAADLPIVRSGMSGGAAAAAGMIVGTGLKMARRSRLPLASWLYVAATLAAAGFLRLPLPGVVLAVGGASVLYQAFRRAA